MPIIMMTGISLLALANEGWIYNMGVINNHSSNGPMANHKDEW